ncbi:MAG: L-ascorbate metabolism protein UlaG (beta-lactamase superfamily) [Rubritalea sp.]|jgi:L-ascorbate metabolism protein UlaG (beta-lactamase superfamily)
MKKMGITLMAVSMMVISCKENKEEVAQEKKSTEMLEEQTLAELNNIKVLPISHATFVMDWDGQIIYVDPVGGTTVFKEMPAADITLITDVHYDHLEEETLAVVKGKSVLVTPQAVADKMVGLKSTHIIRNGETKTIEGIEITSIPMYNLTEARLDMHVRGRGNGYVLEKNGYRVYISEDTEDIPEMRALKNIDKAFICMNLPYTMDIDQAASAVLEFEPKEVIPYHYQGTEGFQDVEKFKSLVHEKNKNIEVTLMDWYPTAH